MAVALVARRRLAPAMAAGLALCGVMLAALSSVTSVTPALALLALCGAARSFFDVAARTLLQRSIRDEVLARVFGLQEALVMAGLAAGAVIAPFLVVALDEGPALLASGILFVGIGAVAARSLRVVDERAYVPGPELDVLRRVPFLRLLPRHVLEGLSRHAVRVTFPAGAVVIRQGDPGDSFYVVVAGEAAVIAAGVQVATPGPGDYFGEIALLHNVPRTATVAAVSELELLALERRHFLAAVTGSAAGAEQLAEVVDRRLGAHPGGWSGEGAPN